MRRAKITIIGGGNVGTSCALWAASKELGDIVVLDIPKVADAVKGRMLDLAQCGPVERIDADVVGTADYADTSGSDVVIVTAGIPRKPGMSCRLDMDRPAPWLQLWKLSGFPLPRTM